MEAVQGAKVATEGGGHRSPTRLAATSLRVLPDERLARLAADGHKAAFAAIYERHHQALYRYCRTITRNDEDARDALQATMLKAMNALDTNPRKVRAWLYRIAHNESVSILRSGKRHAADPLEGAEPAADAPIEHRRELRELLDDIGHLSERQRQALVMRELGGLSYEEVGVALECSPAAAKQSAFDARAALHEIAEARDADCESIRRRISDGDRRLLRARGVRAHLRSCDPCRRFDAALRNRQAKLAGLVPALSPAASAAILQSVLGGGASGAAAGAATLGGSAAAIGGGVAAGGGAAAGTSLAVKGAIAGIAAIVATGGAIAIERERDSDGGGNGGGAVERAEPAAAPTGSDRAAGAGAGTAGAAAHEDQGAGGAGKDEEKPNANGGTKDQGGSSSTGGQVSDETVTQPTGGQTGTHGGRPPQFGGPPPQGGQRPPGGTRPSGGGQRPPGGTRPPGGGTAPPPGGGTAPSGEGTRPPATSPPPDGELSPDGTRPPRPQDALEPLP